LRLDGGIGINTSTESDAGIGTAPHAIVIPSAARDLLPARAEADPSLRSG